MAASGNSIALKSFQSFAVNDGLLVRVVEAVKAGEKEARSSGDVQSFEVYYNGFRQNISIGRIFIVPAKVCDDRKNFPVALLYGTVVREFNLGEETADLITNKIGDTEFDEYSKADFKGIKERLFKNDEDEFTSLIVFAPSWSNTRDYIYFKYVSDDQKLANLLRHLVFACYFDPRLSSAFNALMTTIDTTKLNVADITPKLQFPFLAENPLKAFPELHKVASNKKKAFLTFKTADEITQEVLDPQELNVFEALDSALSNALMPDMMSAEEAAEPGYKEPKTDAQIPEIQNVESLTAAVKDDNSKEAGMSKRKMLEKSIQDLRDRRKKKTDWDDSWASMLRENVHLLKELKKKENKKAAEPDYDLCEHCDGDGCKHCNGTGVKKAASGQTLEELKWEGADAAIQRGHQLGEWQDTSPTAAHVDCVKCGKGVYVDTKPMPNGIDISGEAVALNCSDKTGSEKQADDGDESDVNWTDLKSPEVVDRCQCNLDSIDHKPGKCSRTDVPMVINRNGETLHVCRNCYLSSDEILEDKNPIDLGDEEASFKLSSLKTAAPGPSGDYFPEAVGHEWNPGSSDDLSSSYSEQLGGYFAKDDATNDVRHHVEDTWRGKEQGVDALKDHQGVLAAQSILAAKQRNKVKEPHIPDWECINCDWVGTEGDAKLDDITWNPVCPECGSEIVEVDTGNIPSGIVASLIAKGVPDDGYVAMSPKAKEAAKKNEANLDRYRRNKKADVPMDIDDIWAEVTEEFGPAPEISLPGSPSSDSSSPAPKSDSAPKAEEVKSQPEPESAKPVEKSVEDSEKPKQGPKSEKFKKKTQPEEKAEEPEEKPEDKTANDTSGNISEAKSELDSGAKAELADNPDATKTVNPEHFAANTEPLPRPEREGEGHQGWANWETWHVNLLIDNEQHSNELKLRLATNVVKKRDSKNIPIDMDVLAARFSRMFYNQYKETKDFYESNAKQMPTSEWARVPFKLVDWYEIAEHAVEEAEDNLAYEAANPQPPKSESSKMVTPEPKHDTEWVPEFDEGDKTRLNGLGIQGGLHEMVTEEAMKLAQELIDTEDELVFDVAANAGQIFGNVKHMSWFVKAVAQEIMEMAEDYGMTTGAPPKEDKEAGMFHEEDYEAVPPKEAAAGDEMTEEVEMSLDMGELADLAADLPEISKPKGDKNE